MKDKLKLLNFTKGELTVLNLLKADHLTPLSISKHSSLSRQGVYKILLQLEKRGLIFSKQTKSGRRWQLISKATFMERIEQIEVAIYDSAPISSFVKVHQGKEELYDLWKRILSRKNSELIGIQGDIVYERWLEVFGLESINKLNSLIKNNKIIVRVIMPGGNFERAIKIMGLEWARHFVGRTYQTNLIDEKYFTHQAEIFISNNRIYIISMKEQFAIEILHLEVVKMFSSLVTFIQANSQLVDGNKLLIDVIEKEKGSEQNRTL